MKQIFEQGEFSSYKTTRLDSAREVINETYQFIGKRTVFVSHKHDDLEDLKDIIGFLQKEYNVKVYIDSRDPSMPKTTSGVTASKIKERIRKCDKFILLATDGAVESKWCNWELGYGDAQKFSRHIALFPMKRKGSFDSDYKGNEYMSIYPYIVYSNGEDRYSDSRRQIKKGYYVRKDNQIIPLKEWLEDVD